MDGGIFGAGALAIAGDVTDADALAAAVDQTEAALGELPQLGPLSEPRASGASMGVVIGGWLRAGPRIAPR